MTERDPTASISPSRSPGLGWLVYAFVIGTHAVFQLLLNPLGVSADETSEQLGFALMGILISEPILFGVWAGLGPGAGGLRLPATYFVLLALTLAGSVKRWNMWWPSSEPSRVDVDNLLWVSGFFLFIMGAVLVARKFLGWRISSPAETVHEARLSQFSLKSLLGMTALCAVLLAIGRALASANGEALVFAGLILLVVFPIFVFPLVVLHRRPALHLVLTLPLVWAGLTWLGIEAMAVAIGQMRRETAFQMISFQAGAVISSMAAAIPLRFAGYYFSKDIFGRKECSADGVSVPQ